MDKARPHFFAKGPDVTAYWARQAQNPDTSAMHVVIPGSTDHAEKGIDTSIVLYLFETMSSWDAAVLFTDDADFVPLVWALRRRGKEVYCALMGQQPRSPLAVAAQDFFPLNTRFLELDLALFALLQKDGPLDQLVRSIEAATQGQVATRVNGAGFILEHRDEKYPPFDFGGLPFSAVHTGNQTDVKPTIDANDGGHETFLAMDDRHRHLFEEAFWHERRWRPKPSS
jgi:hypothetical protein